MTTAPSSRLSRLGDELERACAADLAAARPRRRVTRRALLVAAIAAAFIGGGAAIAADVFSTSDVAHSLPAGTAALIGTDPTCTVVKEGVEYHCALAKPPFPEVTDWKGTKEATVDSTKHVNGGCEALTSDGLQWECWIGEAAVGRAIDKGFLGAYAPAPGHG
jgi:hypothetical protein